MGLPVEILTRLGWVTPASFLAGATMASAAILTCCCLFKIFPATFALCCLAADGAATVAGMSSAKPWFAAGGALLLLDLGLDAARGGAGEACRTVVATPASRTVAATDAAREGYRMVGAMLGSRTVASSRPSRDS